MTGLSTARRFIRDRQDAWAALLGQLVRIPSTFENEHAILDFVDGYVRGLGFEPHHVPMDPVHLETLPDAMPPISRVEGRYNIVVRVPGKGGGRSLALNAHLDINPVGNQDEWSHPPFAGEINSKQGILYGRGAMDDKAGVTILLGILETIVNVKLWFDGDLVFQFCLDDETTGNGSLACLEAGHTADAAVIVDGTRLDKAVVQHAGNMEFSLRLKGKPVSVSVSHLGRNAAETMVRLLLDLRESVHALNDNRQGPWTQFPSPYQFIIHGLKSDAPRFTVPEESWAQCFVTFPPPHTIADMQMLLQNAADEFLAGLEYPFAPVFDWGRYALEPVSGNGNEIIECLQSAAAKNGIEPIMPSPSTGLSDMRHFAKRGIPCVLYGPGRGYNPHRADEYFHVEDLSTMVRVFLSLIDKWCASSRSSATKRG